MRRELAKLEEGTDRTQAARTSTSRDPEIHCDALGGVVSTVVSTLVDDQLWSALGDPTRRRMLDLLLVSEEATATTLGEQLPVSRQAAAKHLNVLDRAGLVHATPVGREKRYRVDDRQFARAVAQLSSVGAAWDVHLRVQ